jgi:hypothetical protein
MKKQYDETEKQILKAIRTLAEGSANSASYIDKMEKLVLILRTIQEIRTRSDEQDAWNEIRTNPRN